VRYEAFNGLVDELARFLSANPSLEPADLAAEGAAALRHVFPALELVPWIERAADLPPGLDPGDMRRAAFAALRAILARVAADRRTVLWIDDLQWGKADSIPLLREILLGENAPAALFLVSFRMDEGEGSAIVAALEAARIELDRPSTAIELTALPPRDAIALAASLLGEPADGPQNLAARVNAEADGSPIFLTLLALALRGEAFAADEEWTLARVVAERLAELPAEAIDLLETLSILGGPLRRSAVFAAAGLAPQPHRLVAALHQERWIRLAPGGNEPALAMAHDRVAEIVRGKMTGEQERARHGSILEALEASGMGPEVKLRHAEGAGKVRLAAELAHEAGDRAAARLTFGQAARFYRRALELHDWAALTRRAIRVKLAGSLVNAGLCGEAAPIYEEAAFAAPRDQNIELRRLAAEQYMVSGRHADGLRVLVPLLRDVELELPATPQRALVATAGRLARLWLRGTRKYAERTEADLDRGERTRIDLCFSAARGLVMSDTVRAGYLPLVGLELALRAGEPRRIGSHLAMVAGAVLTPFGGAVARWRDRLLEQCDEIADRTGDAYVRAAAALARSQIGIMTGSWSESLAQSEAALDILRNVGRGVNWERNVARASELRALDELGNLREADYRARRMAAESRDLGDRYGTVVASLMLGITVLATARADEARRQLAAAFDGWPREPILIQHFYRLRIEVMADLYEDDPRAAQARLADAWELIEKAQFLRVPATRIDALTLLARTALAVAARGGADRSRQLALARSLAKRLGRETRADARGNAQLIRASHASLAGDFEARSRALAAAEQAFSEAKMRRWEALCAAPDVLAEPDVADPRAWRRVCAPGL
jgi:hypothetical protein